MKHKQKGFTLVETLIAILILMTTVVAVMLIVSKILITTHGQRLETTAQYLLQEGVEYLRSNRDSALNGGATWTDYTKIGPGCPLTIGSGTVSVCECTHPNGVPGACTVDPIFDDVQPCPPTGCPAMYRVENSGRKIFCSPGANCPAFYTPAELTSFVRTVRLTPNFMNPDEMFVDVSVSWVDTGGVTRQKSLNTSLFNW